MVERPLLALQTTENLFHYNQACHACHAFCGSAPTALYYRRQRVREESFSSDDSVVVPCRDLCGHVYCSKRCEADAWEAFHRYLCTGSCHENDPLVQFKRLAVQTNEILLLVAEWWVAQHLATDATPYTDFSMTPWWDVVVEADRDIQQQPTGFLKGHALSSGLRELCHDAAELLSQAWEGTPLPAITAEDIAKRIGACEQNAMGIRQRHPLCRDIFNREVREARHNDIVECLEEAGFIGEDDDEQSTDDQEEEEWDYSVEEIAQFLAGLYLDESGGVRDLTQGEKRDDAAGDDLDHLFPPLDGTAMYSIICKMNHSCDPNVMVLYRRTDWNRPLVAHAVALRDICEGEELTISYIEASETYEERQESLKNYGFVCECSKCQKESDGDVDSSDAKPTATSANLEPNGLFGSDSEDKEDEDDANENNASPEENAEDGEAALQQRLERLDTDTNHQLFGDLPPLVVSRVRAWMVKLIASTTWDEAEELNARRMPQVLDDRDYCTCVISGEEIVRELFSSLMVHGSWKSFQQRVAYWIGCVSVCVGHAHMGNYNDAMRFLDKAIILGIDIVDPNLSGLVDLVAQCAMSSAYGPYTCRGFRASSTLVPSEYAPLAVKHPLEQVLENPPSESVFAQSYYSTSTAVKMTGMAREWPAVWKWKDIGSFVAGHGHRLVPIELGSMMKSSSGGMKEEVMDLRSFVENVILPSNTHGEWTLDDAVNKVDTVGYLAQHPLLRQIPKLQDDLVVPSLCGPQGPTDIMMWFGSGGTRTALHYDSYDNIFVQISGVKYVRLYDPSEASKLYVRMDSSVSSQGNMSAVDCEREDWEAHPLAATASYREVVLEAGDAIFIPAGMWHYVRSLTTSISVNYWF